MSLTLARVVSKLLGNTPNHGRCWIRGFGISPVRWLCPNSSIFKFGKVAKLWGIGPEKLFAIRVKISNLSNFEKQSGIGPSSKSPLILSSSRFVKPPISGGK